MYRQPETPPVIIAAAMPHMAILISCRYDGNDANDGISLLEQGSVISVTSVISIT